MFARFFAPRPSRKSLHRLGQTPRPRVEALEDRLLLSAYSVDRLTDVNGGPRGTGEGSGLAGDLRYCLSHAADGDSVEFGVQGTITLTWPLPGIVHSVRIDGPGQDQLTVSGNHHYGVFEVDAGTVAISGLTIADGYNGLSSTWPEAGLRNSATLTIDHCAFTGNWYSAGSGAAIGNSGTLTITNSSFSGNVTTSWGGAIENAKALTISNCTFSGNQAEAGGAIANFGTTLVSNSTFSGNHADDFGSVLRGFSGSTATFTSCTVSGNSVSSSSSGAIDDLDGTQLTLQNSIIAGNTTMSYGTVSSSDLVGAFTSLGHNLIGSAKTDGYLPSDLVNVDPRLGPLQNNGGATQTLALLPGSPALNAGDPGQLGVADQRGVVRSGAVNIGAYQASASNLLLTAPAAVTAGSSFDLTLAAVDPYGQPALGYGGTVNFASSDASASLALLASYTFSPADAGQHTFSGAATLTTAGSQTVTATDMANGNLSVTAAVQVTPAAASQLVLSTVSSAVSGAPFDVVLTAVDAYGNTATGYQGSVTFSSSDTDPGVSLPADYTFQASDQGTHTFAAGATFVTVGPQTLTVSDTANPGLIGSTSVTVTPSPAPPGGGSAAPTAPAGSTPTAGSPLRVEVDHVDHLFAVRHDEASGYLSARLQAMAAEHCFAHLYELVA